MMRDIGVFSDWIAEGAAGDRAIPGRAAGMRDSPCHDCPRRSALCHARCADYRAWAAELARERRAERESRETAAHVVDVIVRRQRRTRAKRRRGQR